MEALDCFEFDPEFGALAGFGFEAHFAAHALDGAAYDGETNASAFVGANGIEPLEHHKDFVLRFFRNADAVILNPQSNHGSFDFVGSLSCYFGADDDAGANAGSDEFDSVAQEVRNDLGEGSGIGKHSWKWSFNSNLSLARLKIGIGIDDLWNESLEVHAF